MQLLCDTSTKAVLGMVEGDCTFTGNVALVPVPGQFVRREITLWKLNTSNDAAVKKTGQELQDALDALKPGKRKALRKRYLGSCLEDWADAMDLLDKVMNGGTLNTQEKQAWKVFADKAKKAKQDMKADPDWPGD